MFIKRSTEELGVKGVAEERSEIASKWGRVTWGGLFPFPEVTAKYGQGARNRYIVALCRDCAISHLGRDALKSYCNSCPRESYFHPGQSAAKQWGPNYQPCAAALNVRLTISPSGIIAFISGHRENKEDDSEKCVRKKKGKRSLDICTSKNGTWNCKYEDTCTNPPDLCL